MKTNFSWRWIGLLACVLPPWGAQPAQALDASNSAPVITIVYPTNQARFIAPADLGVAVVASDPKLGLGGGEFFANTNLIGTGLPSFRRLPGMARELRSFVPWHFVPVGDYTLTAVARGTTGEALGTSAPV